MKGDNERLLKNHSIIYYFITLKYPPLNPNPSRRQALTLAAIKP
jgi:hypothetical protein